MIRPRSLEKTLIITAIVLMLMYFGRILFVPLFFALLVSFIIYPICKWMEKRGISRSVSIGLSILAAFIPVAAIAFILIQQVAQIGHQWPFISQKLLQLLDSIDIPYNKGLNLEQKEDWIKNIFMGNSSRLYAGMVSSASGLIQAVIIPFYVALILYHRNRLVQFLEFLFPAGEKGRIRSILHDTVSAYHGFIKGMVIVYLIVGTLNSIGLTLLGIPNAIIYGFTASILTFIPYVGIIIGSVMPVIVSWALHDSIYYPMGVIGVFALVQFLEANFIFPLAVSYRIKVNTLATIVAIFLGGIIWGAAGMILFIPFVAILKLIADKIDSLKPLAVLLGTNEEHKTAAEEVTVKKEYAERA